MKSRKTYEDHGSGHAFGKGVQHGGISQDAALFRLDSYVRITHTQYVINVGAGV